MIRAMRCNLRPMALVAVAIPALLMLLAPVANAQTDESLLLLSAPESKKLEFDTQALLFPSTRIGSAQSHTGFYEFSSEGRIRLDDAHELNPSLGYSLFVLHPGQGLALPSGSLRSPTLVDGSLAFATPITQLGDWYIGARGGAGYAGDSAFANSDAWHAKASVSTGRTFSNGDALVIWIDYDGNRSLFPDIPLPFFAYKGAATKDLDYILGIPASSIEYRPLEGFRLSASYEAPLDVELSAEYDLTKSLTLFASYTNQTHAFHADGIHTPDRLFFDEEKVQAGLRLIVLDHCQAALSGGYAFGREFSAGFDDRDRDRVARVSSEPFLSLEVSLDF